MGVCAVRKGVHLRAGGVAEVSRVEDGTFLIAGEFLPAYQEKLASMLAHPSVKVLGHRNDVPELMRKSDILVLPSIEEGFGSCDYGSHGQRMRSAGLRGVHRDLQPYEDRAHAPGRRRRALTQHITMLHEDRAVLERLRAACLGAAPGITWTAAGRKAASGIS